MSSTVSFRLSPPPNLAQTLAYARMGNGDPCLRVIGDSVWRATRTPLGSAAERVRLAPDGSVEITAWGPGATWLLEHAPALCGSLDQPDAFQPATPLLQHLKLRHSGLRIGRTESVFETSLFVSLEQRVATHEAWRNWRLMVRALGELAPGPLNGLRVPPPPERIARTPYEVFHLFGVERRRSELIRRLAVVARRLEETVSLPLETAYARFKSIAGVGDWTSARIAMIALGDADAVPLGDLHIPHLVTWALAGERRGSDQRMLELLEPYRGHRARVVRLLMLGLPRG